MGTDPPVALGIAPHPLLDAAAFAAFLPAPLGELASSPELLGLLALDAPAPWRPEPAVADAVRALLRHGGFKPSGRSKPASEYLIRAVGEGALGPINLLVDACNVASLHSGLPISVIDLDRVEGDLHLAVAAEGSAYVFNAGGQSIEVGKLLSIHDARGPIAGPVKDSHATKTSPTTTRALAVVWGSRALPGRAEGAARWYRDLLGAHCVSTEAVPTVAR